MSPFHEWGDGVAVEVPVDSPANKASSSLPLGFVGLSSGSHLSGIRGDVNYS